MNFAKPVGLFALAGFLSACGGSSPSVSDPVPPSGFDDVIAGGNRLAIPDTPTPDDTNDGAEEPATENRFAETGPITPDGLGNLGSAIADLETRITEDSFAVLSEGELQTQGSASYAGIFLATQGDSSVALAGRTTLNATFTDGGGVDGSVTELSLVDRANVEGADPNGGTGQAQFAITALEGEFVLSGGALSAVDGEGELDIAVSGQMGVPAALLTEGATGTEDLRVEGALQGGVTNSDELLLAGPITAENDSRIISLDAIIFSEEQ